MTRSRNYSRTRSRSYIRSRSQLSRSRKHSKSKRARSRRLRRTESRVKKSWFILNSSLPALIEPSANDYFTKSDTLGIYMLCHGGVTSTFTKSPNISIVKQNVGPFGYCTHVPNISSTRHKSRLKILLSLTDPDRDRAMRYATRIETYCSMFSNYDEIANSCEKFSISPVSTIMNKVYSNSENNRTVDEAYKYLYFAYRDKIINLFDCDDATLNEFFNVSNLNSFLFKNKDVKIIDSKKIFMLINRILTRLDIKHVNILDESCNIPYTGTVDELNQFKSDNQIDFYGGSK